MSVFQEILNTYASFFDWHMWVQVLTDPISWGLIGTLVLMEGLLSADNAIVLALMVKHLPEKQQKKALFYGLLGAYTFRFIAIGIGVYLIKLWWVKILGAAYLAWISYRYFRDKKKGNTGQEDLESHEIKKDSILIRLFGPLWGTVITVELMDITFSVDSILAAFGISQEVWVLLLGGMLGVLMMRGVAGMFLKLIERVPEIETTAYIIIFVIAAKMLLAVFDIHISHELFFAILVTAFGITFLVHLRNKKKAAEMNK